MHTDRGLLVLFLVFSFAGLALPVFAQQVIATVPVGVGPASSAVNSTTNKIYVPNQCGNDTTCAYPYSQGTLTVVDGATNDPTTVNVGYYPSTVAVNPVTNRIYVANQCGSDPTCAGDGTVSVIDGVSNTVIATVTVGSEPYGVAVNSVTNNIYVANYCGTDLSCNTYSGTVSVIDGVNNTVTTTVNVGAGPAPPVVNSVTNKIYVANSCGTDSSCPANPPYSGPGTVTVIDGVTNNPTSVGVGVYPYGIDVNSVTNKIYVANNCGDDLNCQSKATMTVIDGQTLGTTDVSIGGYYPYAIAVNSITNKIYVPADCSGDPSCQGDPNGTVSMIDGGTLAYTSVPAGFGPDTMAVNSATNKIYVANECGGDSSCQTFNGSVTVIDGATLAFTNIGVGGDPYGLAVNAATNRVYVPNFCGNDPSCNTYNGTVSVIDGTPPTALQFVPLPQPCRAVDTRPQYGGSGPIQGETHQDFTISGAGDCGVLTSAAAYSLNVTVVPQGSLGYLTIWPAGQPQPVVSTLNSVDGRVKADAAILPAGANGEVSVYVTNTTNVILDVDGYFAPVSDSTLAFYPITPCRVADTRVDTFPPGLGPPQLSAATPRDFPVLNSPCIPSGINPAAYSFNFTVVPGHPVGYLTVWPTGQSQPVVSTLNDQTGTIVANAAIVPAGTGGDISVYSTQDTQLLIDIDGYFAPAGPGGLSLYGVQPCRVIDTRKVGSGQPFSGTLSPPVDVADAACAASSLAQAYVFNATVVPTGALGYLTLWPDGTDQPVVSTLNAFDGSLTNNMAIVPSTNGKVDAYANGLTQLILDISSYFAP
jgi:YVTN family beta-propeller protein